MPARGRAAWPHGHRRSRGSCAEQTHPAHAAKFVARGGGYQYALPMTGGDEPRIKVRLTRIMATFRVRNSGPVDLSAGQIAVARTGDCSDVLVDDADGQRVSKPDVARIDDDEKGALMRRIVDRLCTFQIKADGPALRDEIARWMACAESRDDPTLGSGRFPHGAWP